MRFHNLIAAAAVFFALPAFGHDGLHVNNPYARSMGGIGASGAIFLEIENPSDSDDRLINATSDVAQMVQLHTHKEDAAGVMQMLHVPEGFVIPAKGMHALQRGGDHIMLMGLVRELKDGDMISLTLTFEKAGDMTIDVPVDNTRKAAMDHSAHKGHDKAAVADTTGMSDPDAIIATMKAQFDTPENPLTVEPVIIEGDNALAGWAQGEKGGRALLARQHGKWQVTLCGGADLRMPAFLGQHGVSAAETLSSMYNTAEDTLGADKTALYSTFEGVVMISPKE
jgi:copper(I)-binding protein